ncbi:diguanylate cyclase [Eubacterium sp. MSJ-13]|uniref:GGDEF domain-containing protein n=1 Tax=Eubacterium sp. MSJ-13 TaxID=2841513 RepID=UPI001C1096E4|nr:GGDEF domain-containing protein [Eubacterium sp. MSJ-13]MBU5479464.1 diguanylate cyclase [Eubacterium sp. MSJ-13]
MYTIMKEAFLYTKTEIICVIMLLLVIIKISGWRKKDIFMKLYFSIVGSSLCMVISSAIGHISDYGVLSMSMELRRFWVAVSIAAFGLTIFLWFIYSGIFRESALISNKISCLYCAIPLFIFLAAVIVSCYTDVFYSVSDEGVFRRTSCFQYLFIVPAMYMFFSGAALLRDACYTKNSERRKRYGILAAFIIPVFVGGTIQNFIPESNMLILGVCIGVLTAYMNLSIDEVAQEVIRKNIELEYSQAELQMALEDEKKQHNTVGSLANIYVFMYYISMDTDEFDEIKRLPIIAEAVGDTESASEALRRIYTKFSVAKYFGMMLDFTNLSTLDERMKQNKYISTEYKGKRKGWCRARFIEVDRDEKGKLLHVIFAVQDISEEKQEIVELQDALNYANKKAYADALTGVKNVTAYREYMEDINKKIKYDDDVEFALALFDVNGLKYVNDNFGHEKGNMLIIDSCRCICRAFKRSPVFRIGGDEFVVVVEGDDLENIVNCRNVLEEQFEQINEMYPHDYIASVAVGIVEFDKEKHSCFEEVFKKADEAMYENKQEIKRSPENSWMIR